MDSSSATFGGEGRSGLSDSVGERDTPEWFHIEFKPEFQSSSFEKRIHSSYLLFYFEILTVVKNQGHKKMNVTSLTLTVTISVSVIPNTTVSSGKYSQFPAYPQAQQRLSWLRLVRLHNGGQTQMRSHSQKNRKAQVCNY